MPGDPIYYCPKYDRYGTLVIVGGPRGGNYVVELPREEALARLLQGDHWINHQECDVELECSDACLCLWARGRESKEAAVVLAGRLNAGRCIVS